MVNLEQSHFLNPQKGTLRSRVKHLKANSRSSSETQSERFKVKLFFGQRFPPFNG